jgi:hypothetical protein
VFLENIVDFWHTNLLVYRTFLEGFKALRLQSSCLHKYTQINEFSNIHVPFTLKNQEHTHLFVLRRREVVVVPDLEFALRNSISLENLETNNQPVFNPVGYHFSNRIPGIGGN